MTGVAHLYVHVPFCAHRCGYCDFVTLAGRRDRHEAYVDALLAELALERPALAPALETIYLGGGTPTFAEPRALERLLRSLPPAGEVTVEANPETVTPGLAAMLRRAGVTRVSLGAQSFEPRLLAVLERRAGPDDVRRAVRVLRDAGVDNLSLDLLYGVPGQSAADLERDLLSALELAPEHLSCYELEAKPGTRFTRLRGAELARQAEAMEGYFELVVATLTGAGYRWYETSSFCLEGRRCRHNLATWLGRDYLGLGVGAVSTVGGLRWRNRPGLAAHLRALAAGERPPRELEPVGGATRRVERLMLGLRLDEPLPLADVEGAYDPDGLERLERLGLAERLGEGVRLTTRGRFLGGGATVELLAEMPANELVVSG
ncbi:MAG: radical SAM family heme chaperone HemW [Thermoleophilia bacterium]|nr:radical SAM family heme chaperone HemW [Thermoleophilia bacterium]